MKGIHPIQGGLHARRTRHTGAECESLRSGRCRSSWTAALNGGPALITILLLMIGTVTATAETGDIIVESLASPDRLAQDREHDRSRHPDQVLEFFGIRPGMAVLDLFSGAGYYTEILSHVVGSAGKVVAHNNPAYLDYARDDLERRFEDGRLPNVERITAEAIELELPDSTFDAALVMLTWHDFYYVDEENAWPPIDPAAIVSKLCGALKPGAVLGVTDHVAESGSDPRQTAQELHRIDPRRIRDDLADSCFEFEGEIDVLRNPADQRDQPMFAEGIRDDTDRVVYRFRRMP